MFKRFFGKKNDGFYLQLEDEDATSKPAPPAKVEAELTPVTTPAPSAGIDVAVSPEATTDPAKVSPVVAAAAAAVAKANQKTAKAEEKAGKKNAKAVPAAPVAVVAPVPMAPAITNFATDYLMKPSSSSSRRLPGANMRGFLELARQVDKPKPFKAAASERKAGEK